jgi:hypothetical protein
MLDSNRLDRERRCDARVDLIRIELFLSSRAVASAMTMGLRSSHR